LIRNATDLVIGERPAKELVRGSVKTIGYLGALDAWFDVDSVAQMHGTTGMEIVLVGRMEDQRI
jgi:hypothetical protein